MPKGPQGQKRKADVIGNAILIGRIATGEAQESQVSEKAVAGRSGGKKGGAARAAKLTPQERSEASALAAQARWRKQ